MKTNFSFHKIRIMIFLIILSCGVIKAQEKPSISQPEQARIINQQVGQTQEPQGTIQGSKPSVSEPAAKAVVKTPKPKQVKASRPVLMQPKGARPPIIIRPSGSGIPKGTGNPGGAVGPGRR